jgi:KUP system potassium uptake protein
LILSIDAQPVPRVSSDERLVFDDLGYTLGDEPTMSRWRKRLFLATAHITADAGEYFSLPREQTVILGSRIEI